MISANEARIASLKNPTFQRKMELYNAVSTRINEASLEGKNSVGLTEEEHYGLNKEMLGKGYKQSNYFVLAGNMTQTYIYNF